MGGHNDPVWCQEYSILKGNFIKGRAPGKLTSCEDNFDHIAEGFFLQRSSVQIVLPACENHFSPPAENDNEPPAYLRIPRTDTHWPGVGGFQKLNYLKESMKLTWNLQVGEGGGC